MPRDAGTGVYTVPSGTNAVTGQTISSTAYNNFLTDVSQALTRSLCLDGPAAMNAVLNMNGFKITNGVDPTSPQDIATKHYIDTAAAYLPITGGTVTGTIKVNLNTTGGDVNQSPVIGGLNLVGADGFGLGYSVTAYGNAAYLTFQQAAGTGGVPIGLAGNTLIANIRFGGYDGLAWTQTAAAIQMRSVSNWSNADHSTRLAFFTTPVASTTAVQAAAIQSDGTLYVGGNGSLSGASFLTGAGTVNAAAGLYVNGNRVDPAGQSVSSVINLSGTGGVPAVAASGIGIVSPDAGSTGIVVTSYGTNFPQFQFYNSSGPGNAPAAAGANSILLRELYGGYDGSAWQSGAFRVEVRTNSAWSGSDRSTRMTFAGTPIGSTTLTAFGAWQSDGTFYVGTSASLTAANTGAGTVNAQNGFFINQAPLANSFLSLNNNYYATFMQCLFNRAEGTSGSPTATAAAQIIGTFGAGGYDGSAFRAQQAQLRFNSINLWSGTDRSTTITVLTTAAAATTVALRATFDVNFTITGVGIQPGGGSWTATSDPRTKQDVKDYTQGLAAVRALHPITWRYIDGIGFDTSKTHVGLDAVEAEPHMPEMLVEFDMALAEGAEPVPTKHINATALTYALVNAVKELASRIEALEAKGAIVQ